MCLPLWLQMTAMAARLPARSARDLYEGGRRHREAKLAEMRRQQEEREREATPFKPTIFSKQDKFAEVSGG